MTRNEQIKEAAIGRYGNNGNESQYMLAKVQAFMVGARWADEHPNGSQIKWHTGVPKEEGYYLVTFIQIRTVRKIKRKKGKDVVRYIEVEETIVLTDYFNPKYGWEEINEVIAWCKLSDIEPYKEETK